MAPRNMRFVHEKSSAKLVVWDQETATLSNLFSVKRHLGHAKAVMQKIVDYADKNNLTIVLSVQQYGYADKQSPDNAGLKQFYKKFGFVDCGRNVMQRRPVSREIHGP